MNPRQEYTEQTGKDYQLTDSFDWEITVTLEYAEWLEAKYKESKMEEYIGFTEDGKRLKVKDICQDLDGFLDPRETEG